MRQLVKVLITMSISVVMFLFVGATSANASTGSLHWARSVVYVENHAGRWPVNTAAEDLDNGSGLDLRVVSRCPKNSQCVKVYHVWNIAGPTIGLTNSVYWSNINRFISVNVFLEDRYATHATYRERLAVTCHELGHSVGLQHRWGSTCMNPGIGPYTTPHISWGERRLLDVWY